jgi:SAM-dependent methyltransferase
LDAGTGLYSLKWLASLQQRDQIQSFTAVTAEQRMRDRVQAEAERLGVAEGNSVIWGNWFGNEKLPLPKKKYDTILAEYLIGAIDGFDPYKQKEMIPKLVDLLKPGGRLYLVGWEPIPIREKGSANVLCEIQRTKDACILLAGQRCYREYPLEWVLGQVESIPDIKLVGSAEKFPIQYDQSRLEALIHAGRSTLKHFPSLDLAQRMVKVWDDLEQQSLEATRNSPTGTIDHGFDYLVTIEKLASS